LVTDTVMMFGAGSAGPHGWATDRGLLVGEGGWVLNLQLQMPREVALALRGSDWQARFDPACTVPPTVELSDDAVDRDAAAAAATAVGEVAPCWRSARVGRWGCEGGRGQRAGPAPVGQGGERHDTWVRFWLDLAYAADLIAPTEDDKVAPAARYETWRSRQPADVLAELLAAWRELKCAPLYVTEPTRPALAWPEDGALPCRPRTAVLATAGDLPPGRGVADPGDLTAVVRWR
jgi:hypothetical protein